MQCHGLPDLAEPHGDMAIIVVCGGRQEAADIFGHGAVKPSAFFHAERGAVAKRQEGKNRLMAKFAVVPAIPAKIFH